MSLSEFLRRHTAAEIAELWALEQIDPAANEWRQTARICNTIYQLLKGKKAPRYKEDDWMPVRRQGNNDIIKNMMGFTVAHNRTMRQK